MLEKVSLKEFEAKKNRRAFLYTLSVCGAILVFAVFYTWSIAGPPAKEEMDLIEINLGNGQEGLGEIQPLIPGDMAPDNQSISSVQSSRRADDAPSRQIQADENSDLDAAPVVKTDKPVKQAADVNKSSASTASRTVNPSPVTNPNPTPPKPKTVYTGGTGPGGNNAAQDNGYRNQGYTPGNGDMGSPDGNPDSYGDTHGGRVGGGISISKGLTGRRMVSFPGMKGDFNENAKVFVDITVNPAGKVVSAIIARGTTTSSTSLRNIAIAKAKELKFNPTQSGRNESGTMLFNFVLEN